MQEVDLSRAQWKKSSFSGNTGNCVEVAQVGHEVAIRDSHDPYGPVLVVEAREWRALIEKLACDRPGCPCSRSTNNSHEIITPR
jgi:hypothetical protein